MPPELLPSDTALRVRTEATESSGTDIRLATRVEKLGSIEKKSLIAKLSLSA